MDDHRVSIEWFTKGESLQLPVDQNRSSGDFECFKVSEGLLDGDEFVGQARNVIAVTEVTPVTLEPQTLRNPFGCQCNIFVGVLSLKLFNVISLPMILSTLQSRQVIDEVNIITLVPIELSHHPCGRPIVRKNHLLRNPSNFRGGSPFFEILKQDPITFYHISFTNGGKEKGVFALVREKTEEPIDPSHFDSILLPPDEEVGKGEFRNDGRELGKCGVEKRFVRERQINKLRMFRNTLPFFLHDEVAPFGGFSLADKMIDHRTDFVDVKRLV
jgi:hypothetical protein